MFSSSAPSELEKAIDKATDPNLTSENWEYIMDVCDRVNDDPENGSAQAVSIIQQRLEGDVANRQLYSLTLVSALAQNCGSKMHRELASRSFTGHLLEMASENRIHHAVKARVMEVMETLSREFRGDPSLRQMEDAFNIVKQQNPNLAPPAVPQKHQLTEAERQQEEDDLQLALKLSLQDATPSGYSSYQSKSQTTNQYQSQSQPQQQQKQPQQQQQPKPTETAKGKTAATVNRVRALYDLTSEDPNELSFRRGDVITVIESVYRDWWKGSLKGTVGIFPLNYVTPIPDPTPEELEQEARDEADVFAEARNVEKLLAILSSIDGPGSAGAAEDEELQRLYRSTQAVRPRLIKLIEKYSQKRDDLIDLDKRFIAARKTYDHLIETSLSQIPANPLSYSSGAPFAQQPLQQQQQQQQLPFQTPSQQQQPLYGSSAPINSQPTGSYNNLSSPSSQKQSQPSSTQPQQQPSYLTSQSTGYQSTQPGSYQSTNQQQSTVGYQNSQIPNAYQNSQPLNSGYQNPQQSAPFQTAQSTGGYSGNNTTPATNSTASTSTISPNTYNNQGGYQQQLQSQPTGSTSSFIPSLQPQPVSGSSYSQQPNQSHSQQQQSSVPQSPPTSVPPAGTPLGYSSSAPSQQSSNQQQGSSFIVPAGSDLRNSSYGY